MSGKSTNASVPANDVYQNDGRQNDVRMTIDAGAASDQGQVRENNEDSYSLAPELGVYVLSDGMGGLASGEVASRLVTETVVAHFRDAAENPSVAFEGRKMEAVSGASNRLASAIGLANRAVRAAAQKNEEQHGMGATVVALCFEGERVSVGHVGDSRAYRFRRSDEKLEQLTEDHSFVAELIRRGNISEEQANESNLHGVLIRAVGTDPEVQVDIREEIVAPGDIFLLCSDGLTRELDDAAIAAALADGANAQAAADRLISLANASGGGDNITVIVLRVPGEPPKKNGTHGTLARIGKWLKSPVLK